MNYTVQEVTGIESGYFWAVLAIDNKFFFSDEILLNITGTMGDYSNLSSFLTLYLTTTHCLSNPLTLYLTPYSA